MIVLYFTVVGLLSLLAWLVGGRAARLQQVYSRVAEELTQALEVVPRGDGLPPNPIQEARRGSKITRLADRQDRLEGAYTRWQEWWEGLLGVRQALLAWRGRMTPYLLGLVDTVGVLTTLEALGLADQVRWSSLYQLATQVTTYLGC